MGPAWAWTGRSGLARPVLRRGCTPYAVTTRTCRSASTSPTGWCCATGPVCSTPPDHPRRPPPADVPPGARAPGRGRRCGHRRARTRRVVPGTRARLPSARSAGGRRPAARHGARAPARRRACGSRPPEPHDARGDAGRAAPPPLRPAGPSRPPHLLLALLTTSARIGPFVVPGVRLPALPRRPPRRAGCPARPVLHQLATPRAPYAAWDPCLLDLARGVGGARRVRRLDGEPPRAVGERDRRPRPRGQPARLAGHPHCGCAWGRAGLGAGPGWSRVTTTRCRACPRSPAGARANRCRRRSGSGRSPPTWSRSGLGLVRLAAAEVAGPPASTQVRKRGPDRRSPGTNQSYRGSGDTRDQVEAGSSDGASQSEARLSRGLLGLATQPTGRRRWRPRRSCCASPRRADICARARSSCMRLFIMLAPVL